MRRPTLDDVFLDPDRQAAEEEPADDEEEAAMSSLAYAISDTAVIAERNLLRIPRQPDLLIAFTIQPVMFVVLFVYVFGGAISTPGYDYVDFLMPGIITQSIAFGGFVTALGLNEDLRKGLIDRFRSLPMARSAVLAGRTLADIVLNTFSLVVMLSVGFLVGFNFDSAGLRDRRRHPAAAAVRLRVLVVLRADGDGRELARVGAVRGLPRRSSRSRSRRRRSCRRTRCRTGCRRSPTINPFTIVVNALRALWLDAPAGNDVWGAFAWSLGMIAVFAPLAVRAYRRAALRA